MIKKKKKQKDEECPSNPLPLEGETTSVDSQTSPSSHSELSEPSDLSEFSEPSDLSESSDNSESSENSENTDSSDFKARLQNWLESQNEESLFALLIKGSEFDTAVEQARKEGEVIGRNARIEQLLAEERAGDGVPHPSAGSGSFDSRQEPSIFDLARGASY